MNLQIRYLNEVAGISTFTDYFQRNMLQIFTSIIIPNISITEDDLEEYEFEPEKFIQNDLKESDTESRKRECMKFVQCLSKKFPEAVNNLINPLQTLMEDYMKNRNSEWQKKVTCLNLIITACITGYTYRHGATSIVIGLGLLENYLKSLVFPELGE